MRCLSWQGHERHARVEALRGKAGMRILGRWDGRGGEDDISKIIRHADDPLGLALIAREELEEVLQLAGVLILKETLGASRLAGVPAELRSTAVVLGLLAHNESIPGLMDERLVEEAIHDSRVHPVTLGHARLEMTSDVLNMALASRVKRRTEATSPVLALAEELDDLLGVGACLATMALLVMLVKRVGTPEAAVATRLRAGVLAPALVKLILVALPVVLALEASFARGAPVNVGLSGGADGRAKRAGDGSRRREGKRRLGSGASRCRVPRDRGLAGIRGPDGGMTGGAG